MVCTHGMGRMTYMVRLLGNGNYPDMMTEEVGNETLAAQSIHRELCEADEANLLDEEDMHVFDCNPMVDPLHLVCCNNCKKPVKASQYAAHADRCSSLICSEEILLELDGGTGHKKPPRKGRKKLQKAREGNSASIGATSAKDGSVSCPRSTNYIVGVTSPSEKRTKLIAAEHRIISKGLEAANGVTTNYAINYQKPPTYPPVPLATKMYHSQRNLRLRFALNHLYHETSAQYHCSETAKVVQDNIMLPSQVSPPKDLLHDSQLAECPQNKKDAYSLAAAQEPNPVLVKDPELCLGNSIEYTPAMDFSNQVKDNKFSRPALSVDTAKMGKMRNRYLSTAYSYTGNSGTSLGNIQQPSGSVHVV